MRSEDLPAGHVRRERGWAVLRGPDAPPQAVSARCRHQLGDLSKGSLDKDGCLVCPWHGARYDTTTGAMVDGPKGFLGYHGKMPRYSRMVLALGRVAKLRVATVTEADGEITVGG